MNILKEKYKLEDYIEFVKKANLEGKRIELHNKKAYSLNSYEKVENNEIIDLRGTEEYEKEQAQIINEQRKNEICDELNMLDQKRIRAICEPETIRDDGKTWLEYYNEQVAILREELNSL